MCVCACACVCIHVFKGIAEAAVIGLPFYSFTRTREDERNAAAAKKDFFTNAGLTYMDTKAMFMHSFGHENANTSCSGQSFEFHMLMNVSI